MATKPLSLSLLGEDKTDDDVALLSSEEGEQLFGRVEFFRTSTDG